MIYIIQAFGDVLLDKKMFPLRITYVLMKIPAKRKFAIMIFAAILVTFKSWSLVPGPINKTFDEKLITYENIITAAFAGSASVITSTIVPSTSSIDIPEPQPVAVLVQLKDAEGTNLTTGGDIVTLATSLGSLTSVNDNNDGTYFAFLSSSGVAGTAIITGTINGVAMQKQTSVIFIDPTVLITSIVASTAELPADEKSTALITVTVKTVKDQLIKDAIVEFQTNAGSLSGVNNLNNGNYQITLTSSGTPQNAKISFTVNSILQPANITIVFVEPPPLPLFIPEGFSPDGDGVNDTFVIEGADSHPVKLSIYNRWGIIVFEDSDYKNEWSGQGNQGTMIGEKLPDGTYYYAVNLNDGSNPIIRFMTIKRK